LGKENFFIFHYGNPKSQKNLVYFAYQIEISQKFFKHTTFFS